ncbi:uncharacterized protein LOC106416393 isoform X4 [Brassica napus]|uniref:uncharacterized protein LOC106416393 isoform X4 n=1 Tax=Brassica napus TaxID=3708 RepID=UPI0006AADCA1|nr:uncharacterized protein LOC106416393 isoform X4 [Brassica napus]
MDTNRKIHPDCKYSANPFHECASDCLEKISRGRGKKNSKKQAATNFSLPESLGKKKVGSQSPSPLNTRPYQNGNVNSPRVHQSRPSPVAVTQRTTVPETNISFPPLSSDEVSSNLNGQHDSFSHKPEKKPSQMVPLSPNADRSKTVSPRPREHEHNVGKYRVNSSVSTILQSIIDKHGDIAANCKLESASMRSRYLECLCSLMQELGSTPVSQLTELKVKEMLAVIKDLESVNMDVGWLRAVLEEFSRFQENADSEKEKQVGSLRSKKRELEIHEADLGRMEEEVREGRLKVEEMKAELAELETERLRMEEMGFKVDKFKGRSFLDELL